MHQTPTMTDKKVHVEPFRVAPGHLILHELRMIGEAQPNNEEYKACHNTIKRLRYVLDAETANVPFGHFADEAARKRVFEAFAEVTPHLEYFSQRSNGAFEASAYLITVTVDPEDQTLRRRLLAHTIEQLQRLKTRIVEQGSKDTRRSTFMYSQDPTIHMDMYCQGIYARACQNAVAFAREAAREIKVDPTLAEKYDMGPINSAIEIFSRALRAESI